MNWCQSAKMWSNDLLYILNMILYPSNWRFRKMIQARIFVAKIPFSIKKTQFVGTEMAQWLPHHTLSNLTELGI